MSMIDRNIIDRRIVLKSENVRLVRVFGRPTARVDDRLFFTLEERSTDAMGEDAWTAIGTFNSGGGTVENPKQLWELFKEAFK